MKGFSPLLFILVVAVVSLGAYVAVSYKGKLEQVHVASANEVVEIVGPVPEVEREEYASQAQFNNQTISQFNESGTAIGYVVSTAGPNGEWYYVENKTVHGPFEVQGLKSGETEKDFWLRLEAQGWKVGLRSKDTIETSVSKNGHTLQSIATGRPFSTFDISVPSQSSVLYDGTQVGLHDIKDKSAHSPVDRVVLTDDGLHYSYLVRAKSGYYVVVDGKNSQLYPTVGNLHSEGDSFVFNAISPDFLYFIRVTIEAK